MHNFNISVKESFFFIKRNSARHNGKYFSRWISSTSVQGVEWHSALVDFSLIWSSLFHLRLKQTHAKECVNHHFFFVDPIRCTLNQLTENQLALDENNFTSFKTYSASIVSDVIVIIEGKKQCYWQRQSIFINNGERFDN